MKSLETRQQEIFTSSNYLRVFPGGSAVKNLPALQEGLIPGSVPGAGILHMECILHIECSTFTT